LHGGSSADVCLGEDGSDVLNTSGSPSGVMAFGGPGDDVVIGSAEGELLYGNAGDDTINAHGGDDRIVPGPGIDVVRGHKGDDTVVLYHACEIGAGEQLDGGAGGTDTLVTPLSVAELTALGVFVNHFEVVVIDTENGLLAECS
jgi:Ca2+-binding RTX toxin-like protein